MSCTATGGVMERAPTSHVGWGGGNLTRNGKKGRQIPPGRGLIRESAGVGAACVACKASEPLGGGGKQSAISSRGF